MKELQKEIATETIAILAKHYKVTVQQFSKELAEGNEKLLKEVLELCEKTYSLISKEVA